MTAQAFEIAQAILVALGGGGLLVFALSSFLGKMWAQRILQKDKLQYDKKINEFKSKLESKIEEKSLNYKEKLELYKVMTSPLVEMVTLINKEDGLTMDHIHEFNRQRLYVSSQLGLFAPQTVFDAFNEMVEYIYDSLGQNNFKFGVFTDKSLKLLSEMRKDIGIYTDNVVYNGHRKS